MEAAQGLEESVKAIFLDIDGVVAPHGRPNPDVWCHETVMLVKRLVDETGAKVVLVSSWPEDLAREMLAVHSISMFDAIAERDRRGGFGRYDMLAREAGIVDYLEKHKPEAWVWLDDWMAVGPTHPLACGLIRTTWTYDGDDAIGYGFDEHGFCHAKAILRGYAQHTKDFTWSDGPDPTTWPWKWRGHAPGYLEIVGPDEHVVADVYGGHYVRIYPVPGTIGLREEGQRLVGTGIHPMQLAVSGVRIFEGDCTSWRDGVRIVEEWLRDVPVWGTPDDIRWTGWLGRRV
jgi:hypothetical protein